MQRQADRAPGRGVRPWRAADRASLRRGRTAVAAPPLGDGRPGRGVMPGAGLIGLDYLNIHDQVSQFTTSVLYDRAGTGWSDQVELPRTRRRSH